MVPPSPFLGVYLEAPEDEKQDDSLVICCQYLEGSGSGGVGEQTQAESLGQKMWRWEDFLNQVELMLVMISPFDCNNVPKYADQEQKKYN